MKTNQKPSGYWNDYDHIEQALRIFIEEHGTPGMMPTAKQLNKAGFSSFVIAIQKHGGFPAVAEKLGLTPTSTAKPRGYWDDFDHIKEGIDSFIKQCGTSGIMPTQEELKQADRHDLIRVMHKHGGFRTVAGRLGLEYIHTAKPRGYWDDFIHLKEFLSAFVEKQGTPGIMPTAIQLRKAGYSSISDVIKAHGGFSAVAEQLGLELSYAAKPANYWDDFAHLEQELRAFMQEHGTPGAMPTLEELKKAGRNDLPSVINKHGGVKAAAEQLGLEIGYSRRPIGYWDDFANVEKAIRAFIEEHGTPGVMPSSQELRQADLGDLPSFLSKHGGMAAVAERLGLKLSTTAKPSGYWNDFANVEKAIRAFIEEHGTPGIIPTASALNKANQRPLVHAIYKHGGFSVVSQQSGLTYEKRSAHYWDNFANVEQALLDFNEEWGTFGVMPTVSALKKAGYSGVADAMSKHGGREVIAERLGWSLKQTAKPHGHWDDFSQVEKALRAIMEGKDTPGIMPTHRELRDAGRNDLLIAIYRKHGGMDAVARRLGVLLTPHIKQGGFWDEFANIEREIHTLLDGSDCPDVLPTLESLRKMGYSSLASAIVAHGGIEVIAKRLGLTPASAIKKPRRWERFSEVEQALITFIEEMGTSGVMPTLQELKKAGRGDLVKGIQRHGSFPVVAKRLGLQLAYTKKPIGYWQDEAHIEQTLRTFIEQYGTSGVMPSQDELIQVGMGDLVHAIQRSGGFAYIARRLSLQYARREQVTPRTAADIARIAYSIQPLAESNLLSGAQIMVILRRAGMLNFRSSRINRLNAILVNGEHNQIESALSELRMEPEELITETTVLEESANEDLTAQVEAGISHTLESGDGAMLATSLLAAPVADIKQERAIIRGLSALGEMRLPLDEILALLTSKVLWEAFYRRLYTWYGSLNAAQTVDYEDIQAAILSTYPEHMDNEFVAKASAIFLQEVQQAVNFMANLPQYGWQGPRLHLHQADAARRMLDVLVSQEKQPFLLNADDPGMGKSAAFLAAVATSNLRSVILIAPKTVADDTWAAVNGEIHRCLPHAHIVRGINNAMMAPSPLELTFFILHYEELLNMDAIVSLTERHFDCLCIDEIHLIKQRADQENTHRRAAIEALRASVQTAIGLTGTPLVNELTEPMSILQTLSLHDSQFDHTRLSNYRMSDISDVFEAMLPHIVRRRKKDVLLHLPECDVHSVDLTVPIDIDERMRAIYSWPKAKTSQAIVELRKLATEAKLPYILQRAQNADKLLILTYLTEDISEKIASYLEDFFPGQIGHINGQVAKDDRQEYISSFRASNGIRILVGTIGTIGVGLTLFDPIQENMACEIIVADLPYTSAEFDQGIARLHREGQKHRVTVDILQTTTRATLRDGSALLTIDQRIWELILGKRELSNVAIDGKYDTTDSAAKVRKALHRWLKQAREIGIESLDVERRPTEQSEAQKWRGEIGRLRAMSASKADEVFANTGYAHDFLHHLKTSIASKLAHLWLRARLDRLLRSDLEVIDMGCGLNPFADLSCHVIGLDRHDLPGQLRGKMENPPLADKSADVLIYSLSLYGTADDLLAYFTHASRILRGGGHLFIVEPASTFTSEGIVRFLHGLRQFGFEQVDTIKDLRGEDGALLKGMHFTLTGEMGQPEAIFFERK